MECRKGCGACCIHISISSSIPGMPGGKPAGVRCVNLTDALECTIHGTAAYPDVCRNFKPSLVQCGDSYAHATRYLAELEELTKPDTA